MPSDSTLELLNQIIKGVQVMMSRNVKVRGSSLVLLVLMIAPISAFAGSAVVGSVAGSMNATFGGQALLPNTTVFSGDSLQVKEGAAAAAGQGPLLFLPETESARMSSPEI